MPFFGPLQLSQPAAGGDPRLTAFLAALTQRGGRPTSYVGPGGAGVSAIGYQAPRALTPLTSPLTLPNLVEPSGGIPPQARANPESLSGLLSGVEPTPNVPTMGAAPFGGVAPTGSSEMGVPYSGGLTLGLPFGMTANLGGNLGPFGVNQGVTGPTWGGTLATALGFGAGMIPGVLGTIASNVGRAAGVLGGVQTNLANAALAADLNAGLTNPAFGSAVPDVEQAALLGSAPMTGQTAASTAPTAGTAPNLGPGSYAGVTSEGQSAVYGGAGFPSISFGGPQVSGAYGSYGSPVVSTAAIPMGLDAPAAPAPAPTADAAVSEGSPVGLSGLGDAGTGGGGGGGK